MAVKPKSIERCLEAIVIRLKTSRSYKEASGFIVP